MKKYEASFPFYWWEKSCIMTWSIFHYSFLSNQKGNFSWKVRYIEHTLFLPSAPINLLTKMPRTVGHVPPSLVLSLSLTCSLTCSVSLPVTLKCEWWVLSCFLDSNAEDRHRKVFLFTASLFSEMQVRGTEGMSFSHAYVTTPNTISQNSLPLLPIR